MIDTDPEKIVYVPPETEYARALYRGKSGAADDGYGSKIKTDIVCRLQGETFWRRVYATCYSNAASHWICGCRRETLHLPTLFWCDIPPLPAGEKILGERR